MAYLKTSLQLDLLNHLNLKLTDNQHRRNLVRMRTHSIPASTCIIAFNCSSIIERFIYQNVSISNKFSCKTITKYSANNHIHETTTRSCGVTS